MSELSIKSALLSIIDLDAAPHDEVSLQLIYDKLNMVRAYVESQLDEAKKPTYMNNFVLAALGDKIDQEVIDTIQKQQEKLIISDETDPDAIADLQTELSQVRSIITYAMSKYSLVDIKHISSYDIPKHSYHIDEITTGYLEANDIKYNTTEHADWWTKNGKDYNPPKCKPFTLERILSLIEKRDSDIDIILHTRFATYTDGYWDDVVYK